MGPLVLVTLPGPPSFSPPRDSSCSVSILTAEATVVEVAISFSGLHSQDTMLPSQKTTSGAEKEAAFIHKSLPDLTALVNRKRRIPEGCIQH